MTNKGLELNNRELFQTLNKETGKVTNTEIFSNGELRAYKIPYTDPLILNFKLMFDYDKPIGLLAPETNIDSALAYLKRIGEEGRFNMLKRWIEVFKDFIKNYDFLILSCEGISEIVNHTPYFMYTPDDKLTFTIRETSDMFVQSLLTTYREIWFDNIRCVEVLPANLRRFDFNILIYNAGYYNMEIYDDSNPDASPEETKIFPTLKKLSDKGFFPNAIKYAFNHHLVHIGNASFNTEESGKTFFENLSNEMSDDYVKNTLVFNFRFANYSGVFNNIFGEINFAKELAKSTPKDSGGYETNPWKAFFKNVGHSIGASAKALALEEWKSIKSKPKKYLKKLTHGAIGNAYKDATNPGFIGGMIKDGIDLGINKIEEATVDKLMTKLNNLVINNFPNDITDIYDKFGKKTTVKSVSHYTPEEIKLQKVIDTPNNPSVTNPNIEFKKVIPGYAPKSKIQKNIELGQITNAFSRGSF